MRIFKVAALGLVVSLAACGGGSGKKSSSIVAGNDQASTPYCVTLGKLASLADPRGHASQAQALIDQAVSQAPANLVEGTRALSLFLGQAAAGPTTTLSKADATRLETAITTLDTYEVAHCGLKLPGK